MNRIIPGIVMMMAVALTARAQAPSPASATSSPPDIAGIWGAGFLQSLGANPPLLPGALKRFKAVKPENDPLAVCQPPGLPRLMDLAFPFEIVQTPKVVYFLYEYGGYVRRIYIDGTHPKDPDPTWLGYSSGKWEGRTLVVDTIGLNDRTWLDMLGHPHSEALHVIERYTLSEDGNNLKQEVTIDDPMMYSKPWDSVPTNHKRVIGGRIQEYICVPS